MKVFLFMNTIANSNPFVVYRLCNTKWIILAVDSDDLGGLFLIVKAFLNFNTGA